MSKYLVSEIPENQHMIIDVPEGFMRVCGAINPDTGEGNMAFSQAFASANTGEKVSSGSHSIPLLQMRIQSPEKALTIAQAFTDLAIRMKEFYDEEDMESPDCDECSYQGRCFGQCEEDDGNG